MSSPKRTTAPKPPDSTVRVQGADLAALFERHLGPVAEPRQPGEFTVGDMATMRRISGKRANAVLTELVARGVVARRVGQRNQYLYRFVE